MKNDVKVLLLGLTGILCLFSTARSQQNFKPGYVITSSNDSLKGSVDFREWGYNPARITFRNAAGQTQVFSPADIREFGIPPRDFYVSRKVSLDLSSFKIDDLMSYKEPRSAKDTLLFLTVIVKSRTSLFFIKDMNDREHFYIEKENRIPEELILKKNIKKASEGIVEEKSYIVTTEIFKGQLILLFADCPALKEDIDGSEYKTASLRSLIIRYNKCQPGGTVQFVKKPEKIRARFGLLAGLQMSHLKFTGSANEDLPAIHFPSCSSFTGGVSLYLVMPRERAQYILLNELVYQSYSTQGTISQYEEAWQYYINSYSFDIAYIKLNTLLRYQYPNWVIHPFANIGMSNGYAIKTTNTRTSEEHLTGKISTETGPVFDSFRKYEMGLLVGAGASFLGIGAEFRVEWANGMSTLSGEHSTVRSYYVLVSYTF